MKLNFSELNLFEITVVKDGKRGLHWKRHSEEAEKLWKQCQIFYESLGIGIGLEMKRVGGEIEKTWKSSEK